MPRFHIFQLEGNDRIAIDLDAIYAVRPAGSNRTWIDYAVDESSRVIGSFDDVVALINPPAAVDTYEEDLARLKAEGPGKITITPFTVTPGSAEGLEDRPMTSEEEYNGPYAADAGGHRIDELYRTVRSLIGQADAYWPKWVKDYVDARVDQIEGRD